jgi:hypothetical protein
MGNKEMEGNNEQRRAAAKEAREQGKSASETGTSLGSSKQREEASESDSHQERIDGKRQGKPRPIAQETSEARPGSRDGDTADRERYPELADSDDSSAERGTTRATRGRGSRT